MHRYTPCPKNVPPLACYNFDTREWILTFFGRNVIDKVSCHKILYYATSSNLYFCTTWQNGKHGHCIFTRCISCALPEFNQLLLDFFSLFDSRLILMLLYDSLNIVISAFSLGLWRHGSRESKSTALQQVDCVACKKHQCTVFCVSPFAR